MPVLVWPPHYCMVRNFDSIASQHGLESIETIKKKALIRYTIFVSNLQPLLYPDT